MTKWTKALIFGFMGYLLSATSVSAFGNIYQDAIPHLKACLSLIQEQEGPGQGSDPVDLRVICPTLSDFLSYEPLSEIDPPLENFANRLQLASLVAVLEASKQVNQPVLSKLPNQTETTPGQYNKESQQKPFFLALAHWSFSQLQTLLSRYTTLTEPRIQHTAYIIMVNLAIITSLTIFILYFIMSGRSSRLYVHYFKKRWQHQASPHKIPASLDDIADLRLDLQIPALIRLIKQNYRLSDNTQGVEHMTNETLLHAVSTASPQCNRNITRLIQLHDRMLYAGKTVAADEISHAIELARNILANKETS